MFDNLQPVSLTERAAEEVRHIMQTKNIPVGYGLRIGIRGGSGCGGHQLMLGFDKARETDLSYSKEGILCHVDKRHMMYVIGKTIDFQDRDDARGFVFIESVVTT
jgi:iron-sulfur cluster assembly protein